MGSYCIKASAFSRLSRAFTYASLACVLQYGFLVAIGASQKRKLRVPTSPSGQQQLRCSVVWAACVLSMGGTYIGRGGSGFSCTISAAVSTGGAGASGSVARGAGFGCTTGCAKLVSGGRVAGAFVWRVRGAPLLLLRRMGDWRSGRPIRLALPIMAFLLTPRRRPIFAVLRPWLHSRRRRARMSSFQSMRGLVCTPLGIIKSPFEDHLGPVSAMGWCVSNFSYEDAILQL